MTLLITFLKFYLSRTRRNATALRRAIASVAPKRKVKVTA